MSGFIGFGRKESTPGPSTTTNARYRIVPFGFDVCDRCDRIRPLSKLIAVAVDVDGMAIYNCAGGCGEQA